MYKQKGPINSFDSQIVMLVLENKEILQIFFVVLNAVMNNALNGSKEALDIAVYDAEKCLASLCLEECINDVYEAGLRNDKLNLLYLMNQIALVASC